jgi:hypothetical protein
MDDSKSRYPKEAGGDGFTPPSEIIPDLLDPIKEDEIAKKARLHDIPLPERIQPEEGNVVIDAADRFGADDQTQDK